MKATRERGAYCCQFYCPFIFNKRHGDEKWEREEKRKVFFFLSCFHLFIGGIFKKKKKREKVNLGRWARIFL